MPTNQKKSKRDRGRLLTEAGWRKLQEAIQTWENETGRRCTYERMGELAHLDPGTASNIVNRKARADLAKIQMIFGAFQLPLQENDHTSATQTQAGSFQTAPNFVGREEAITDLNALVNRGARVIVIQARGGVGKTTLAWQYLKTQGFDLVLDLLMAKETQNTTSVEGVIEEWLRRDFDEEPGRDFGVTLKRLSQKLRDPDRKVGVLIDNLEPALDQSGRLIEPHRRYVELLRVLTDPAAQSVTLVTSRERLREADVTVQHYLLKSLGQAAWQHFFESRQLQIEPFSLVDLHKAYGGNAKAMEILSSAIQEDFSGDLAAYWQANQEDLFIERDLEDLVINQFNRSRQQNINAYNLVCRLGCYRYQDVPTVPIEGLLCLLWDVPEDQQRRVVKALQDRSLVDFQKGEFWLHPVIRAEAIARLRGSEDWETANRKAADFWTEAVETVETANDALKALEAYYHYMEISDSAQACNVIIRERDNKLAEDVPLSTSFYRLGLFQQMMTATSQIVNNIEPDYSLSRLYNVSGDLYWATGHIHQAIKYQKESIRVASRCLEMTDKTDETYSKLEKVKLSSLSTTGLCKIYLLELNEALKYFGKVYFMYEQYKTYKFAVSSRFYIAFINSCLGDKQKAFTFAEKLSDEVLTDNPPIWATGYRLVFLGRTYKNLGNFEKSFEIYNRSVSHSEKGQHLQFKAIALSGLGELYREQKSFKTALAYHLEAVELLDKIGAKPDAAEAYYQFGLTYQAMGEVDKSNGNFQEAIRLFSEMGAPKQVEKVRETMTV